MESKTLQISESGYNVAREAALEALREFKKEERDRKRKQQLRNVGLLMENYLDLQEHLEKIKYRAADMEDYFENLDISVDMRDEVSIQAIKRSKIRTVIMVAQIETTMELLKKKMEQRGEYEKFQVMKMLYMDTEKKGMKFNQKVIMVAEDAHCHEATVRRWNNEMLNELSKFIFGADGLKIDF
ncbi:MAG TPA: hypothetical protein VF941_00165 [Clostridia bacterium]